MRAVRGVLLTVHLHANQPPSSPSGSQLLYSSAQLHAAPLLQESAMPLTCLRDTCHVCNHEGHHPGNAPHKAPAPAFLPARCAHHHAMTTRTHPAVTTVVITPQFKTHLPTDEWLQEGPIRPQCLWCHRTEERIQRYMRRATYGF